MSLQQDIQKIIGDASLSHEEKGARLARLVSRQELDKILSESAGQGGGAGQVALKEPLKPKTKGMKTIAFSIHKVYFDQIIKGVKPIEYRDWTNEYYQRKCSYVEDGKRYLTPFDAIVLYVGRGKGALTATVALKNITCDGKYLMFWVGKVLWSNSPLWHGGG